MITKKRILLVGDGNHQFITNYAFRLKKKFGADTTIDILSLSPLKESNLKYYDSLHQLDFSTFLYRLISKFKGIRRIYRFLLYDKLISSVKEYHFVHFHFIDVDSYYLTSLFKKNFASKIILTIWGSDLYRLSKKNEKGFIKTLNEANTITFTNEKSKDYFCEKFGWGKGNLMICRFGLAPLESLRKLSSSKVECKRDLGIVENKVIITIGYNLSPSQQHLKILEQFSKAELKAFKDRIALLFPISYGGTTQYKEELLSKIKGLPFEYYIFDTFLPDEQIALIRKASDLMIQLQESDQFSGSMQEHMYAENVVITGSWLPYDILKERGVWFLEVSEINQLTTLLPKVVLNLPEYKGQASNNKDIIARLSFWENNIEDWVALYQY